MYEVFGSTGWLKEHPPISYDQLAPSI